jgi:carboxymethylenebutenolidase
MRSALIAATTLLLTACGGGSDTRSTNPSDEAATAQVGAAEAGELPPSIAGLELPLRGRGFAYVPGDPTTSGYLSVPEGDGPFPAVILIHEWSGLVDRVRRASKPTSTGRCAPPDPSRTPKPPGTGGHTRRSSRAGLREAQPPRSRLRCSRRSMRRRRRASRALSPG